MLKLDVSRTIVNMRSKSKPAVFSMIDNAFTFSYAQGMKAKQAELGDEKNEQ